MKIHPLWWVCLATRLSLAVATAYYKKLHILLIAIITMIGISFIYRGFTGSNNEVQIAPVFWHDTRFAHGIFYLLSAIYLYNGNPQIASIILVGDVIFSILYRIITSH
jgi:hypothetical protein